MFYKTVKAYCPVCKELLGWRQRDSLADFYCKDCDVTFYFHPNDKKPTNNKMKQKPNCGCGICGR